MAERPKGPWVIRLVEQLYNSLDKKNIEIERLKEQKRLWKIKALRLIDFLNNKDKKIERVRRELSKNIESLTDIFECADRITTGNVSHNIKWLKVIVNEMIIQNRQALKERK